MALALFRLSRKSPTSSKMGSEQSSPAGSPQAKSRKNEPMGGPCDIIAIVQSKKNSKDKFRDLIQGIVYNDGDVNATTEHGMTALHYAVLNGDELTIKVLIAFGAACNAKNEFNQTPLDMAIDNRKEDLVPLLVSIGCLRGSVEIPSPGSFSSRSSTSSPPRDFMDCPPDQPLRKRPSECSFFSDVSPVAEGLKRVDSVISMQLEQHMGKNYEASTSIRPDEAYAYALQEQELRRFKSSKAAKCGGDVTPPPIEFMSKGGCRILSLDGGGMRGLIQLDILSEIERLTGKRIVKLFDWIIGNSIGGIMALGLVYKDMSLDQLRKLYFRIKDEVFSNKGIGFGYNTKVLEKLLQNELGMDQRMCDVRHPKVLVTAVDKTNTPMNIHYFNNCFDDQFSTQPVWKVARYTSAAPLSFKELDNYVDGGVMANNPCDGGLARIQSFYQARNQKVPIACMVSVGSGVFPPDPLGSIPSDGISLFGGAKNLLRLLSDALGQSEAIAERCKTSCDAQGIPFYRFSPPLDKKISPTETDTRKLTDIMITARIYMHTHEDYKLDKLLPLLLMGESRSSSISR